MKQGKYISLLENEVDFLLCFLVLLFFVIGIFNLKVHDWGPGGFYSFEVLEGLWDVRLRFGSNCLFMK